MICKAAKWTILVLLLPCLLNMASGIEYVVHSSSLNIRDRIVSVRSDRSSTILQALCYRGSIPGTWRGQVWVEPGQYRGCSQPMTGSRFIYNHLGTSISELPIRYSSMEDLNGPLVPEADELSPHDHFWSRYSMDRRSCGGGMVLSSTWTDTPFGAALLIITNFKESSQCGFQDHFSHIGILIPLGGRISVSPLMIIFIFLHLVVIIVGMRHIFVIILGAVRSRRGLCRRCGYVLRGLADGRCPECGSRISKSTKSIVWTHK